VRRRTSPSASWCWSMTRDVLLPSGLSVESLRPIQAPMVTFEWSQSAPHRLNSNVQSSDSVRSRSLLRRRPMVGSRPRHPSEDSSWDSSLPRSRDCSDRPLPYLYIYSSFSFVHSFDTVHSLSINFSSSFEGGQYVGDYLPKVNRRSLYGRWYELCSISWTNILTCSQQALPA
jgi:hypothetical protein